MVTMCRRWVRLISLMMAESVAVLPWLVAPVMSTMPLVTPASVLSTGGRCNWSMERASSGRMRMTRPTDWLARQILTR